MKRYFLPLLFFLASMPVFAQLAGDVLRYSYLQPGGTARYLGAGGAFGALGAEYSSLSNNPAGLAMFRSNELVFTPSLKFSKTEATLPGSTALEDTKSNFGFDNVGFIFNTTPRSAKWKTFNVGIGLNRLNNYHQASYYQGDANGSILNGFFADAQSVVNGGGDNTAFDPFGSMLAFDANAIYYDQDDILTSDFVGNEDALLTRTQTINTSGRMNEMVLSFAGNYDEKLMIGATIGVPFVNYRLEGEYQETDPGGGLDGNVPYFAGLTYTEFLKTEGVGFNLKMGVTYRVSQMLRLGAAFHTPTYLGLTDTYSNTFAYDYEDGGGSVQGEPLASPDGISDYRLKTPWRAIGSAAVLFKKYGFLSADVEVVDYSANAFNLTADVASADNQEFERGLNQRIQRDYRQTTNIRVGGEVALDNFRLRAGVNLLGKPEAGATGYNMAYTAGAGVRGESFYLDLGYRLAKGKGAIRPYADAPVATTDNTSNEVLLTVGFKF